MKEEKNKKQNEKSPIGEILAPASMLSSRGRVFEGIVTKKFPKRVVIESEKVSYVHKYERYYKKKTRLHARLPEGMDIETGDYIKIRETRPLSKIIHFVVVEKIKDTEERAEAKK